MSCIQIHDVIELSVVSVLHPRTSDIRNLFLHLWFTLGCTLKSSREGKCANTQESRSKSHKQVLLRQRFYAAQSLVGEKVRREKALDFSGCNPRPGTGSLHKV